MSKKKGYKHVFEQIAREYHVVANVRQKIDAAIQAGLSDPDPEVRAKWASIPRKGEMPTPDELIAYVAWRAKRANVDVLLRQYIR